MGMEGLYGLWQQPPNTAPIVVLGVTEKLRYIHRKAKSPV